jgi:hypothetical protein
MRTVVHALPAQVVERSPQPREHVLAEADRLEVEITQHPLAYDEAAKQRIRARIEELRAEAGDG